MKKKYIVSRENLFYILVLLSIFILFASSQFYFIYDDFSTYQESLSSTNQDIQNLKNILYTNNTTIDDILTELEEMDNETILFDPTYEQAYNFIKKDETNLNTFDEVNYNCNHFSRDVNNNAKKQGLRCGYVIISLSGGIPHAIVAFDTTDQGIVFFEPQNDMRVLLEKNKDYWNECLQDDTIYPSNAIVLDYTIFW
jgi:hypothetical protein